ncbi:MAG: cytochrome c biogenesis protein ResB [Burkholderiaceae bacterium]|nr:cytochrome c biogenesis protein ResB [Burkholderiaceae bacterium]
MASPPLDPELDQSAPSTGGLEISTRHRILADTIELLSSMRFAISALVVVCIASAIGTIVGQNAPPINYVNQFGAFWAEVFSALDIFRVYNAPWFLVIMGLMLVSTSLCLVRNTPKMLKDARAWREKVRDTAFPAFKHRQAVSMPDHELDVAIAEIAADLKSRGYRIRSADAAQQDRMPVMVARKGTSNRFGYIAAHLAIVVISLGGLLDSELPLKAVTWWSGKTPLQMAQFQGTEVPDTARLPASTPSYRANSLVPEGGTTDVAVIAQGNGTLLLDLPFELHLKQFRIDYYPTGMPKLFASDVVLKDKQTGETKSATIEVNKPLIHRGVAIYQSSFDDGGSALKLVAYPMAGPLRTTLPIDVRVGQSVGLRNGQGSLSLEITGFKPINVENISDPNDEKLGKDPFQQHVATVLSPALNSAKAKTMRNVGPSINYKLRDPSGQAKEFHTYMLPVELDGIRVFLAGMRNSPDEQFRYLRIPADAKDSLDEFMRLRAALLDPALRSAAAKRFAAQSAPANIASTLAESSDKALTAVAEGGIDQLGQLLEKTVPEAERDRATEVVLRLLTGSFWELWQQARAKDGLAPMVRNEDNVRFAQLALNAVSDAQLFNAPLLISLKDFQEVKASVFQVTRSPGKTTVYIGCLLLTLGIFAMLYIQERRVWLWASREHGQAMLKIAASTPRQTMDFDKEFSALVKISSSRGSTT